MKRITRERLKRCLTQRQVAKRLGMSYSTYFKIEQGRHVPGPLSGIAQRVEMFFGYRLKTLLADV